MKRLMTVLVVGGILAAGGAAWLLLGDSNAEHKTSSAPVERARPIEHIERSVGTIDGAQAEAAPRERKLPMAAKSILDPSKRVRPPPEFSTADRSLEARLLGGETRRAGTPDSEQPTEEVWEAETYTDPEWFPEGGEAQ